MPHHGQVIGWPQATTLPTYTVWRDGAVYYAMNNTTGAIDFQGADPAVVVQACLTAGGAGTKIGLREAIYVALTGVAATANNQSIYGLGEGTYWDATALVTQTHAFRIEGFTGCGLRNFAIECAGGGGLVNYCVFINDGADDFHLIDLTIVDSDTSGIHITGTTISQGHLHRCHILTADVAGISVDMDVGNFMYRLHIEDCDVGNCGTDGITIAASGGNLYCEIINNIVYSCGGNGISVQNFNHSQVRGNICFLNSTHGIYAPETDFATFLGNICILNVQHGIYIFYSDSNLVQGNYCYENDSGNTNSYDGICLSQADRNMVVGNYCKDNDRQGIMVDADSDYNKVSLNYTEGNGAGSIRVNNANCDGNHLGFNTVEEGAPTDVGTLTRGYGNFDPSANAFFLIGAAPF